MFLFYLFVSGGVFYVNMFRSDELLADFILRTECAFITVDGLDISMFRLALRRDI